MGELRRSDEHHSLAGRDLRIDRVRVCWKFGDREGFEVQTDRSLVLDVAVDHCGLLEVGSESVVVRHGVRGVVIVIFRVLYRC